MLRVAFGTKLASFEATTHQILHDNKFVRMYVDHGVLFVSMDGVETCEQATIFEPRTKKRIHTVTIVLMTGAEQVIEFDDDGDLFMVSCTPPEKVKPPPIVIEEEDISADEFMSAFKRVPHTAAMMLDRYFVACALFGSVPVVKA